MNLQIIAEKIFILRAEGRELVRVCPRYLAPRMDLITRATKRCGITNKRIANFRVTR